VFRCKYLKLHIQLKREYHTNLNAIIRPVFFLTFFHVARENSSYARHFAIAITPRLQAIAAKLMRLIALEATAGTFGHPIPYVKRCACGIPTQA
jgi:hypothetical protein